MMSMYKRYDLDVFYDSANIYHASFSSINNLTKFACGFDRNICEIVAIDSLMERSLPIENMCDVFEGEMYGI